MTTATKKSGFTLTEVMLAAAILSIGFVLIAGAFPVAAKLTATATERSIAAVTADEAFAKMRLYCNMDFSIWDEPPLDPLIPWDPSVDLQITDGVSFNFREMSRLTSLASIRGLNNSQLPFVLDLLGYNIIPDYEFYYPTTNLVETKDKKYHWSALWRYLGENKVLVTVFVNRLGEVSLNYPANDLDPSDGVTPAPVKNPEPYMVNDLAYDKMLSDRLTVPDMMFFGEGTKIVDDLDGQIYTVTERLPGNIVVLDRDLPYTSNGTLKFWVIPTAINGGRWPCVGIFQRIIEFK